MSDLDQLIALWLTSLSELSETQVAELEDHLRQEVDALRARGLTDREAFMIAAMRCGTPHELSYEFARADGAGAWSTRLRWMVVGFLACAGANALIATVSTLFGAVLVARGTTMPLAIALRILMLSGMIALAAAAWHLWIRQRSELLNRQPPRWITRGWTLALLVGVSPWLLAGANMLRAAMLAPRLSNSQLGQLALSESVVWIVLPFTAPLILLIIAVSLAKRESTLAE